MGVNFIKIFVDELIVLEKVDGTKINCIIQSSKNNFELIHNLTTELQDLYEIVVTVNLHENKRLDFPIRIKDIHSIERIV